MADYPWMIAGGRGLNLPNFPNTVVPPLPTPAQQPPAQQDAFARFLELTNTNARTFPATAAALRSFGGAWKNAQQGNYLRALGQAAATAPLSGLGLVKDLVYQPAEALAHTGRELF